MRKKLHTLLVLSLLSAATLAVSCNKDKEDPIFDGRNQGNNTGTATNTIGNEQPTDSTALVSAIKNRILFVLVTTRILILVMEE